MNKSQDSLINKCDKSSEIDLPLNIDDKLEINISKDDIEKQEAQLKSLSNKKDK